MDRSSCWQVPERAGEKPNAMYRGRQLGTRCSAQQLRSGVGQSREADRQGSSQQQLLCASFGAGLKKVGRRTRTSSQILINRSSKSCVHTRQVLRESIHAVAVPSLSKQPGGLFPSPNGCACSLYTTGCACETGAGPSCSRYVSRVFRC